MEALGSFRLAISCLGFRTWPGRLAHDRPAVLRLVERVRNLDPVLIPFICSVPPLSRYWLFPGDETYRIYAESVPEGPVTTMYNSRASLLELVEWLSERSPVERELRHMIMEDVRGQGGA